MSRRVEWYIPRGVEAQCLFLQKQSVQKEKLLFFEISEDFSLYDFRRKNRRSHNIALDQSRACSNNKHQLKHPECDKQLPGRDCRSAVGEYGAMVEWLQTRKTE